MSNPELDPEIWMLDSFLEIPCVKYCLVLSADGLVTQRTPGVDQVAAETIAAASAGLLASAIGGQSAAGFAGEFRQLLIEYGDGYLFLRHAGPGARLAVATTSKVDPGLVATAMVERIIRVGRRSLAAPPRTIPDVVQR